MRAFLPLEGNHWSMASGRSDTLPLMIDKLDALVVDEMAVAREDVAGALARFVRFTRSGELLLEPEFDELNAEQRVLCVLLAVQAQRMLGLRDTDEVTPGEVVALSGMPEGTVRPKLSTLLKSRQVAKSAGRYSMPIHSARRAIAVLGRDR